MRVMERGVAIVVVSDLMISGCSPGDQDLQIDIESQFMLEGLP